MLLTMPFRKIPILENFDNIPKFKIFLISAKNPSIQVEKRCFYKKYNLNAFYSKFATFTKFLKKLIVFFSKKNYRTYLRNS